MADPQQRVSSLHTLALSLALIAGVAAWTTPVAEAQCPPNRFTFLDGARIAATALTPNLSRMPVVADFDGDGRPDFAAHDSDYFRSYETTGRGTRETHIGVYLNRSKLGVLDFAPAISLTVGEPATCFNCANETDLQAATLRVAGSAPDLVASLSANDAVYVMLNDLNGPSHSFLPPVKYPVGKNPVWVRIGDFDGDGLLDIATINLDRQLVVADVWSISFLRGHGDGTFDPAQTLVLSDSDRLGPTNENTLSPYEIQHTDVEVIFLDEEAEDVLVTSGILVGAPRVWWIEPGASGFSAEVGGNSSWQVPITKDQIFSDTQWVFPVPMLGDAVFWRAHGGSISLRLAAHNSCAESNAVAFTVSQ